MAKRPLFQAVAARTPTSFNVIPLSTIRAFSTAPQLSAPRTGANKDKANQAKEKARKRRKKHNVYKQHDLKQIEQFTLCDAMRYIKAFEVGRTPSVPKYEIAIKLKTKKDGPVLRNVIRLPHSVKTDIKVCVICPPNSKEAKAAREAGAALVGEEEVFEICKNGKIDFDRCITTPASLPKIMQAGIARILGPRGLMPSVKLGTVVDNVGLSVQSVLGGSTYRERQGVVRMAVGQLGFTPEMLRDNVKTFVGQVKKEAGILSETVQKDIYEVVLSATNSPGFSLNGEFRTDQSPTTAELSVA